MEGGLPGEVERGEVEWARGECREESAAVVTPLDVVFVAVFIVRGVDVELEYV